MSGSIKGNNVQGAAVGGVLLGPVGLLGFNIRLIKLERNPYQPDDSFLTLIYSPIRVWDHQ